MQEPRHDVEAVALSPDGRILAYSINEDGFSRLFIRDLPGQRDLPAGDLPGGVITSLEWADSAQRLAIGISGPGLPCDVWFFDAATGRTVRATESTLAGLDPASFVRPEHLQIRSFDGETI